jgi:hypothetical protein
MGYFGQIVVLLSGRFLLLWLLLPLIFLTCIPLMDPNGQENFSKSFDGWCSTIDSQTQRRLYTRFILHGTGLDVWKDLDLLRDELKLHDIATTLSRS